MPTYRTSEQSVVVQQVTVELNQSFEKAKAALEALIPALNPQIAAHLAAGEIALTKEALEVGPELAIFGSLNHGGLLRISGQPRKAIQYSIGNPLTASKMTRLAISAALYAPLRVLLYEAAGGAAVIEYDKPSSLFGQFGDAGVIAVARELDSALSRMLDSIARQVS